MHLMCVGLTVITMLQKKVNKRSTVGDFKKFTLFGFVKTIVI